MSEFKQTFNSSLGKKLIMALTGLFLCTFINCARRGQPAAV
jgi:succinate dehydrogenase / fumarate reductase cytochrome b subunit